MKDNDIFHGDNKKLASSIEALLSLDAKGCLVPHGIGGAARTLLSACLQRLTAADERVDAAIALLECALDTGELTREKHLELEADICQLVTDFWGDRKAARIPSPPRCPDCGYTEQDCREQMDHHLCGSPEPAPARKP